MKKKLIFMMLLAGMMLTAASCTGSAGPDIDHNHVLDDVEDQNFELKYFPLNTEFRGTKLYVMGMFMNMSDINDIVGIEQAEIIINDKNGDEQARAVVNSSFAHNCVLSPGGSAEYNFSCDLAGTDTISSVWDVRYDVAGSYQYIKCKGENCPYCGGHTTVDQHGGSSYPDDEPYKDDFSSSVVCYWCHGSGECSECNGTGRNDATSAVLSAMGCTLCDRTGRCHKCGGTGYLQ